MDREIRGLDTLKVLRAIDQLSRGEAAKSMGMSEEYLFLMENGKKKITAAMMEKIAKHYGVSFEQMKSICESKAVNIKIEPG